MRATTGVVSNLSNPFYLFMFMPNLFWLYLWQPLPNSTSNKIACLLHQGGIPSPFLSEGRGTGCLILGGGGLCHLVRQTTGGPLQKRTKFPYLLFLSRYNDITPLPPPSSITPTGRLLSHLVRGYGFRPSMVPPPLPPYTHYCHLWTTIIPQNHPDPCLLCLYCNVPPPLPINSTPHIWRFPRLKNFNRGPPPTCLHYFLLLPYVPYMPHSHHGL